MCNARLSTPVTPCIDRSRVDHPLSPIHASSWVVGEASWMFTLWECVHPIWQHSERGVKSLAEIVKSYETSFRFRMIELGLVNPYLRTILSPNRATQERRVKSFHVGGCTRKDHFRCLATVIIITNSLGKSRKKLSLGRTFTT